MRQITPYRRDSLFDFMSEVERAFDDLWSQPQSAISRTPNQMFHPAVDLHETADSFLISLDLPGMDQKDIKVDVQKGRLTISGERRNEHMENEGMFKRVERSYGSFERSFQLPQNVDDDKVQARFENGVLEVLVPKIEAAKPRSIEVESSKGGLFSRLLGQKNVEGKKDQTERKPH